MKKLLLLLMFLIQLSASAQIGVSYYNGQPIPTQLTFMDKPVLNRSATASNWSGFSLNWQHTDENNVVFEPALSIGWVRYKAVEVRNFYGTPQSTSFSENILNLSLSAKMGYLLFAENAFINIIPTAFLNGHFFGNEPFEFDNSSQLLGASSSSEFGGRMAWGLSVIFRSPKIPGIYLEPGWESLKKRENAINYLTSVNNRWFVTIGYRLPKSR